MKDIYIFDLDGTLADCEHRRHLVTNGNKQWDEFHSECINDTPIHAVISTLSFLYYAGCNPCIYIVSGRSASVKTSTEVWLDNNHIPYSELIMRPEGDYTPDHELKRRWLHDGTIPKERVIAVFDDRQKVVDMWRAEGLTCFQVAKGDF